MRGAARAPPSAAQYAADLREQMEQNRLQRASVSCDAGVLELETARKQAMLGQHTDVQRSGSRCIRCNHATPLRIPYVISAAHPQALYITRCSSPRMLAAAPAAAVLEHYQELLSQPAQRSADGRELVHIYILKDPSRCV